MANQQRERERERERERKREAGREERIFRQIETCIGL